MSYRSIIIPVTTIILLASAALAAPPTDMVPEIPENVTRDRDNFTFINANRILMFVTNHGVFGRDIGGLFGYDYGTFYPYTSIADVIAGKTASPLYAAGLWIGGIDSATGELRVAIAEYGEEYVPGPMAGGTYLPDNPAFKVYKLYKDSLAAHPNSDYLNWPVNQGAPVNSLGQPAMMGDQMLWSVFTDANPTQHINHAGSTNPLGIEVQQTVWASNSVDDEGLVINLKYKIYNKGNNTLKNCYLSLWGDPDLGGAGDDLVGCDTLHNIAYCYNATNNDLYYGNQPPAIGFKILYGPIIPSIGDNALFDGLSIPDYKNLKMTSFTRYRSGTDPESASESYHYLQGFNADGSPFSNGTKYMFPGDPVSGIGDLDNLPSDKRMMASCGSFDFRPGDSQFVMVRMAIGNGGDRLSSITRLRYILNPSSGSCADLDSSGDVNMIDIYYLINELYGGGPAPVPPASGDANANGSINILDITYMINYMFKGGPAPHCL